jgi:hypothetical protein
MDHLSSLGDDATNSKEHTVTRRPNKASVDRRLFIGGSDARIIMSGD